MNKILIASAIAAVLSTPAFSQETPVGHCDHFETMVFKVEDLYGLTFVEKTLDGWVYETRSGDKWSLVFHDEEACLVKNEAMSRRPAPKPLTSQKKTTFQFDEDGGECNSEFLYAQFGYEGMVYVEAGRSRYIPEGQFGIISHQFHKDGLVAYEVGDQFDNTFTFYVLPSGHITVSPAYLNNPSSMKHEGNVDVLSLKPCYF